ncbi:MAG: hypothetical protein NVS3B28_30300 [Candidatus Velthaea sp.]
MAAAQPAYSDGSAAYSGPYRCRAVCPDLQHNPHLSYTHVTERGNLVELGANDTALFDVPADFTEAK